MKIFVLSLIFIINSASAKFAPWVANMPCSFLSLEELKQCEEESFSNQSILKSPNNKIELKGIQFLAKVRNEEPIYCHEKQKVDWKRFYPKNLDRNKFHKFFVKDLTCDQVKKGLTIKLLQLFCDTPGAMGIRDCFLGKVQYKNQLLIGHHLERSKAKFK